MSLFIFSIRHFHISHNANYLPPKKFCRSFVFHFSWVLQPSQEKLKTMLMQNLGGGGQVRFITGNVKMAYRPFPSSKPFTFKSAKPVLRKCVFFCRRIKNHFKKSLLASRLASLIFVVIPLYFSFRFFFCTLKCDIKDGKEFRLPPKER